jgi:hypothetical protein
MRRYPLLFQVIQDQDVRPDGWKRTAVTRSQILNCRPFTAVSVWAAIFNDGAVQHPWPDRLRAFDGAAFRVLSLIVLASVPSRNNPVIGGVLPTGPAGEMPAGWTSGQSRQSLLLSRWRRCPGSWRWRGDLIVTDVRPREFLQLSDGSYVRVTSTDDGELMPVGEPVKPQRARSGSASTATAFSSHVVADAPGCGLCTWSPREGRWALKFVNQACVLHRDAQVGHD